MVLSIIRGFVPLNTYNSAPDKPTKSKFLGVKFCKIFGNQTCHCKFLEIKTAIANFWKSNLQLQIFGNQTCHCSDPSFQSQNCGIVTEHVIAHLSANRNQICPSKIKIYCKIRCIVRTSALAMACLIAGEGFVTVSLLRSTFELW